MFELNYKVLLKIISINTFILFSCFYSGFPQEASIHHDTKKTKLYANSSKSGNKTVAVENKEKITWISFEEAVIKSKKEPRKIVIDVYTSWCGWCKHMDAVTYENPEIIKYINQKYYAVKLDAEQKEDIQFKDKKFIYKPEFKAHELAMSLLNNKMGYPTTVFMDEAFAILAPVAGFIDANSMEPLLKYFGDNSHKTQTWEEYQKTFVGVISAEKPSKIKAAH